MSDLYNNKILYVFPHNDSVSIGIRKHKCIEPNNTRVIKQILERYDKPIFLDIGANIGYYTVAMSDICDYVLAVEPLDICIDLIKKSIIKNNIKNVKIEQCCITDKGDETVYLHKRDKNIGATRIVRSITDIKTTTLTLDQLFKKYDLNNIHLIKIDIEGYEPVVINNSIDLLKSKIVKNFVLEITPLTHENKYTKAYNNVKKMLENLYKYNYKIYDIGLVFFGDYEKKDVLSNITKKEIVDFEQFLKCMKQTNILATIESF